jgi:hypothetical protein
MNDEVDDELRELSVFFSEEGLLEMECAMIDRYIRENNI